MTVAPLAPLDLSVGSPDWWVRRLHKEINDRLIDIETYDAYYAGMHPAPWLAPQAVQEFRRLLDMTRSNYMGLVVDATVERMRVQGFRLGDNPEPDKELWRVCQANDFDVEHVMGIRDAVKRGRSFVLVAPNATDENTPHIWFEDAREAVVAYVPGTNRRVRAAALKLWIDDWTGYTNATLYLPDWIYKYEVKGRVDQTTAMWQPREVPGEDWPARNPLGVVPLIEIPNIDRTGVSEIDDVIPIQDRINKTLADRMMSQDFGAFPQKWAVGYPSEDSAGNATAPIDVGRDRMVTTDVSKNDAQFGQWDAAPLDPFSAAKSEDVNDIAARTRTPPQYLLGRMVNLPGAALEGAESGLVAKVLDRIMLPERALEEAMLLVRKAAGVDQADDVRIETDWRNPQFRTEAQMADAAVKKYQAGITTLRQTREDLGYSPAQISRMEAEDERAATDPTMAKLIDRMSQVPNGTPNGG